MKGKSDRSSTRNSIIIGIILGTVVGISLLCIFLIFPTLIFMMLVSYSIAWVIFSLILMAAFIIGMALVCRKLYKAMMILDEDEGTSPKKAG